MNDRRRFQIWNYVTPSCLDMRHTPKILLIELTLKLKHFRTQIHSYSANMIFLNFLVSIFGTTRVWNIIWKKFRVGQEFYIPLLLAVCLTNYQQSKSGITPWHRVCQSWNFCVHNCQWTRLKSFCYHKTFRPFAFLFLYAMKVENEAFFRVLDDYAYILIYWLVWIGI